MGSILEIHYGETGSLQSTYQAYTFLGILSMTFYIFTHAKNVFTFFTAKIL
jgi:hypothetical protein